MVLDAVISYLLGILASISAIDTIIHSPCGILNKSNKDNIRRFRVDLATRRWPGRDEHRCAERVFAHGIALKSRISPRARARAAASVRLLSREASTNLQDPTLFDERDSRGHNRQRAGPEKGNTVARSKKVLQRGIRTWRRSRYQIGPAADLADNPRSLVPWLASAAAERTKRLLVISDATSYFTRASPRSTFLCGSYDVGSLGRERRVAP